MANPVSSLESHPQKDRIVDAIVAGRSLREIAKWAEPAVTPMALSRFKSKALAVTSRAIDSAKQAIANNDNGLSQVDSMAVTKASLAVAVDPFLAQVIRGNARRDRWIDAAENAEDGPDHRALAAHDRNGLSALELHARLAGRLDQAGAQVNVQIVIPATVEPQATPIDYANGDVLTIDIGSK